MPGFGAMQNLTLLAAFARAGRAATTTASAMWNTAFDAGMAVGALALGFLAAGIGLDWTYVVVARAAGRGRAAGLGRRTGRRPFLIGGVDPVGHRLLRADEHDLLARPDAATCAGRPGRCGWRRAARRAAADGCWPGRAAPAGSARASARATAVSPGAEEDQVADLGDALEQAVGGGVVRGQERQELVGAAAALGGRIG